MELLPDEEKTSSLEVPASKGATNIWDDPLSARFAVYNEVSECSEPRASLINVTNIPTIPPGNCMFLSLMRAADMTGDVQRFKSELANSAAVETCGEPDEAKAILTAKNEWGNVDCIYIFSRHFGINVCVHAPQQIGPTKYAHYKSGPSNPWIHLHFSDISKHFTPYIRHYEKEAQAPENIESNAKPTAAGTEQGDTDPSDENEGSEEEAEDPSPSTARFSGSFGRYLVADAREPEDQAPWVLEGDDIPLFTAIQPITTHPFAYNGNLVCFLPKDMSATTEVIEALLEREYIKRQASEESTCLIGDILVSERKNHKILGAILKHHIDDRPLRCNLNKCVRELRRVMRENDITSIGIIRDVAIMPLAEWTYLASLCEEYFHGSRVSIILFLNNLPVPRVEDRYALIKEYHESSVGGHKGIRKTYERIAHDYYWKNMRADVKQVVKGCHSCQTKKLVRVKTRLPMIITDTASRPFEKVSLDFYGPLEVSASGNKHILTIQDTLTKFCILIPMKLATAKEVARAITNKLICNFGPPAAILTDQGTNFLSKTMEEFAHLFNIEKYCTTAYHPQSNGGIERMHHTLTEYLKQYVDTTKGDWDKWVPLAQHAYNTAVHESSQYTPHELVFGYRARTPSSFPPQTQLATYDDYLRELAHTMTEAHTIAALNQLQAKHKSKYYYDRKLNTKHFREGEMVYLMKEPKKNKFEEEYTGPHEIIKVDYVSHNATLNVDGQNRAVHIDKLKRAFEISNALPLPEENTPNMEAT